MEKSGAPPRGRALLLWTTRFDPHPLNTFITLPFSFLEIHQVGIELLVVTAVA
jgi:hypothetical protein